MEHDSVIVAGGGPAGLVVALGLARRGISVSVFEREHDVMLAPRAMTYHWSCLYGLEDLGLLDDMISDGFLIHEVNLRVLRTGEDVTFSTDPLKGRVSHPYLLTLGQDQFARVVVSHLSRLPNVSMQWGTEVGTIWQDDDRVTVELTSNGETSRMTCDWLIGAQGASGTIRSQLGLGFGGMTWPEKFIATNVHHDFSTMGLFDGNLVIDPDFGAVVSKVRKDDVWRVTWSEPHDLPESKVAERVEAELEALLGPVHDAELLSSAMYNMHQRAAEKLRVGRVALMGDCAHVTNPTSGLGLVGALHDSYILSEAVAAILNDGADPTILDKYSDDRLSAFWTVTSPVSTESKRLVFHSTDADRLEVDLQAYRRVAADPALLLSYWLQSKRLETPSVVTGKYLSAGRTDISAQ